MIKNDLVLADPLNEAALPLFATKLNINHFSPTQGTIPDGAWIYKYLVLTQEQRRTLPSSSAMKAGVAVNNILQKNLADTIWKFGTNYKLTPVLNHKLKKEFAIKEELEEFKNYTPVDEKDLSKKEKYLNEIVDVATNGFLALKEIGVANLYTISEEQISITTATGSPCLLPVVGRTDFVFGKITDGALSSFSPSLIIELKTQWSKLGKIKKDGDRSFLSVKSPTTPNFNHLMQCAFYSAYYNYTVPVKLLYCNATDYKIFDSSNCDALTVEGLKRNFQILCKIFKRREKLLSMFEELPKSEIIENVIDMVDPMFDHPWCWNNLGDDFTKHAKELWKVI